MPDKSIILGYIDAWRLILRGILRWDEKKFDLWVADNRSIWDNPFLNHEEEGWYVAPLFIPPVLRQQLGNRKYTDLRIRIMDILRETPKSLDADFGPVTEKVRGVLRDVDADLPEGN